ncbi:MAG TPA: hypothetical protein GXZ30_13995 [Propionibacterium sp.]|jgi:hypothetical protein|nr:hypothetical protein [Propionibacterium sp.]
MNRLARLGLAAAALTLVIGIPGVALAEAPTPAPAPAVTQDAGVRVSITTPETSGAPAYLTVAGLTDGQWVSVVGAPVGWTQEAPYPNIERQQQGSAPMQIRIAAPAAGWPEGVEYQWQITPTDGTSTTVTFTYTGRGSTAEESPRPPQADGTPSVTNRADRVTKPAKTQTAEPGAGAPKAKDTRGGLAQTGC